VEELIPQTPPEGENLSLPLDALPTMLYGPEPSKAFVESVRRFGVMVPVAVIATSDNSYRVLDGRRRVKACRLLAYSHIPAVVFDVGTSPSEVMTVLLNEQRSANPVAEFRAITELVGGGASMDDIADATGLSKAQIHERMRLGALDPRLLERAERGEIKPGTAKTLSRLAPSQQDAIARKEEKVTGRVVREAKQVAAVAVEMPEFEMPTQASLLERRLARVYQALVEAVGEERARTVLEDDDADGSGGGV
jgi:ParB family transcriptional regulator, chromosome partitioning protein